MKSIQQIDEFTPTKIRKNYSRRVFTQEEDEMLMNLINKYPNNWKKISNEMKDRNIRQCKERYFHYLSPDINHSEWTQNEDSLLLNAIEKYGRKWKLLESYFPGRTEIDIRNRFYVLDRTIKKKAKKQLFLNVYNENINMRQLISNIRYEKLEYPQEKPKSQINIKNKKNNTFIDLENKQNPKIVESENDNQDKNDLLFFDKDLIENIDDNSDPNALEIMFEDLLNEFYVNY